MDDHVDKDSELFEYLKKANEREKREVKRLKYTFIFGLTVILFCLAFVIGQVVFAKKQNINIYVIGDSKSTTNKSFCVNTGVARPCLRYNGTSSKWEMSNDGSNYADVVSAVATSLVTVPYSSNTFTVSTGASTLSSGGRYLFNKDGSTSSYVINLPQASAVTGQRIFVMRGGRLNNRFELFSISSPSEIEGVRSSGGRYNLNLLDNESHVEFLSDGTKYIITKLNRRFKFAVRAYGNVTSIGQTRRLIHAHPPDDRSLWTAAGNEDLEWFIGGINYQNARRNNRFFEHSLYYVSGTQSSAYTFYGADSFTRLSASNSVKNSWLHTIINTREIQYGGVYKICHGGKHAIFNNKVNEPLDFELYVNGEYKKLASINTGRYALGSVNVSCIFQMFEKGDRINVAPVTKYTGTVNSPQETNPSGNNNVSHNHYIQGFSPYQWVSIEEAF